MENQDTTEKKERRSFNWLLAAIVLVPWVIIMFVEPETAGRYYLAGAGFTFLAMFMYITRKDNERGRWRKDR